MWKLAWRESGLSQAAYCRQQDPNRKTFSVWTRRVQVDLSLDKDSRTKRSQAACDSRLHFSEKVRQQNHAEI
jgi:hypothetical protein